MCRVASRRDCPVLLVTLGASLTQSKTTIDGRRNLSLSERKYGQGEVEVEAGQQDIL
jgi:hypothetical protein